MKRASRSSVAQSPEAQARAVLTEKSPDFDDVVRAIRAVNPTGRVFSQEQSEARYALKSALQSLLLRRWHEDLVVEPDARDPDIVLLRHAQLGVDACHASLRQLDEDARTLAEHLLDATPVTTTAPRARGASGAPTGESPLARLQAGRRALESYDYEEARAQFETAFADAEGSVETARALLELLVDHLADDAAALALVETLPAAVARDAAVRDLLAVAAARDGEDVAALRFVGDGGSPRAGEALSTLARRAVLRGDVVAAEGFLRTLRASAPTHPSLRGVEDEFEALRRRLRAPQEARVAAALAEARWEVVEAEARALLAAWPESEIARRALHAVAQRRDETECAALTAAAQEALAREDVDGAARALVGLHQLRRPSPTLDAALHALRERLRRKAVEVACAGVVDRWRRGEVAEVLRSWSVLDDAVRAAVRDTLAEPALAWIEELAPHRAPASDAAIAATMVLREVLSSEPPCAPETLLARLTPHERTLRSLPAAMDAMQRARGTIRRAREAEVATRVRALDAALDGGRLDEARALLDALQRDAPEAAALSAHAERLATLTRVVILDELVERALRDDDPLTALSQLRLRRMLHDEPELGARAETLRAAVAARWPCRRFAVPGSLPVLYHATEHGAIEGTAAPLLTADGRVAVIPFVFHDVMFVVRLCVDDGAPMDALMLRVPLPLDGAHARLVGSSLEVTGGALAVSVDLDRGEISWWIDLRRYVPAKAVVEGLAVLEHGRLAAISLRTLEHRERLIVVDVARGMTHREGPGGYTNWVHGVERVALMNNCPAETRFVDPHGQAPRWPRPIRDCGCLAASAHPTEGGMAAVIRDGEGALVVPLTEDGATGSELLLPAVHADSGVALVCSKRDARLVAASRVESMPTLYVLAAEGRGFRIERTLRTEGSIMLLGDVDARDVVVLGNTRDGLRLARLREIDDAWCASLADWDHSMGVLSMFRCRDVEAWRPARGVREEIRQLPRDAPDTAADGLFARFEHNPDELLAVQAELVEHQLNDVARAFAAKAAARHPRHWKLLGVLCDRAMFREDPDAAAAMLAHLPAQAGAPQHLLHVYGVALILLDRRAEAADALRRASLAPAAGCALTDALAVATWRSDEETAAAPGSHLWVTLRGLEAAESAAAQEDWRGVVAALDRAPFVGGSDLQVLARLAEAWLAVGAEDGEETLRKAIALASFVATWRQRAFSLRSFPLAGRWSDARIEATATSAEAWLRDLPLSTDAR